MTTAVPLPTEGTRRRNLAIVAVAAVTALALVFFMISSVTGAAWTDTTRNDGNSWNTGQVSLTDNDLGVAMFSVTNMVPGQVEERSITVKNESTVALDVRLYGENLVDSDPSLAEHLNLKIGTSAGGTQVFAGTLGTLEEFSTSHTDFASGTADIVLAPDATQTYHFWVELDADAPGTGVTSVQGKTATMDFVWEGQTQ